ncbi:hypothetical protein T439DRAFT_345592 [Meredithblackwellia eburnea MCA 4105]
MSTSISAKSTIIPSTACINCRRKKRACKAQGGGSRFPCSRCIAAGVTCPGPTPEGRGLGPRRPPGTRLAQLKAADTTNLQQLFHPSLAPHSSSSNSPKLALVRTNPPSPRLSFSHSASKINSFHLSLALQHHLAQVHLTNLQGKRHQGMEVSDPIEKKYGVAMRTGESDAVVELAIQKFLYVGTRHSNHSAIVGDATLSRPYEGFSGPARLEYINVGLRREGVQKSIEDKMTRLILDISLADPVFAKSIERLFLAYICSTVIQDPEDQRRAAYSLLQKGLLLRNIPDCSEKERQDFAWYLADLARIELHNSLWLGQAHLTSLDVFAQLFPATSQPYPIYILSASEISLLLLDISPADTMRLTATFVDPLIHKLDLVLRRLSYHPIDDRVSAFEHSYNELESVTRVVQSTMSTILPFVALSPGGANVVPDSELRTFVLETLNILIAVLSTLGEILTITTSSKYRSLDAKRGEEVFSQACSSVAGHMASLMKMNSGKPRMDLGVATRISQAITRAPKRAFETWCERFPSDASVMLGVVVRGAYGSPAAGRLAMDMAKCGVCLNKENL